VVVGAKYSVLRTSLGARLSGSKPALSVKVKGRCSRPNASVAGALEESKLPRLFLLRFLQEHIQAYISEKQVKVLWGSVAGLLVICL
jgi:hypothetical protein